MRQMDKVMVWGAWGLMAAVGSVSAWKISQTPKVEPAMVQLAKELTPNPRVPQMPAPPPLPGWEAPDRVFGKGLPPNEWAGSIKTAYIGSGVDPTPGDVYILSLAKISPEAKADLDGVTIGWTLSAPAVKLQKHMTRKESAPEKFTILRQCEDGNVEKIAELGPKERSFTDLATEPRMTYRYWVTVTGKESDWTTWPAVQRTVTKELPVSAEARTPSATRLKLVGGDPSLGLLKVETYDRTQKKWILKIVQAAAGRAIGKSGWTLNRLRLDGFYLVADVTDDEGVDRVLSTKD